MSRTVPLDEDAACDRCGKAGALDFMGDYFCNDCLSEDRDGYLTVKAPLPTDQELSRKVGYMGDVNAPGCDPDTV